MFGGARNGYCSKLRLEERVDPEQDDQDRDDDRDDRPADEEFGHGSLASALGLRAGGAGGAAAGGAGVGWPVPVLRRGGFSSAFTCMPGPHLLEPLDDHALAAA